MKRTISHTETLNVQQTSAACDISTRTVYTDECLGPGNLKMVQLAKKVGARSCWCAGRQQEGASLRRFCPVSQFGSAVKLPGSGGAVVGLCLDGAKLVRAADSAGPDSSWSVPRS